jgi:hypothetical protein
MVTPMAVRAKLDQILALPDPLMTHQYVIESISDKVHQLFHPTNYFQLYVESLDIPFKTFATSDRHIMTTKKYYAEYNSFNGFNATFYEDKALNTIKGFTAWQGLITDEQGNYNEASKYWASMNVLLLDGQDNTLATALFTGVFPTQVTNLTMSGSDVTRVTVQVSFSVNKVIWKFNK